jgi:cysteine-rich repeat protein
MFKYKEVIIITVIMASTGLYTPVFAESYCGDNIKNEDFGEECDDGNFINRDGCNTYCKIEDMTPPSVVSASVSEGATDISTMTNEFTVTFSEPVDPETINETNIQLKRFADVLDIDLLPNGDNTSVTINVNQDLFGESQHSIVINNLKDDVGNKMSNVFVRSFNTGVFIDHTGPNIVIQPKGGDYTIAQSVTLTPYIGQETWSEDFLDEGAAIYYTLDGSYPTAQSTKYTASIPVRENLTLKYLGVDKKGNKSDVKSEVYRFSCGERLNAVKVSDYPACLIEECNYGYELKNNVCIALLTINLDDYKANAATAPLFGSDTPITISTKPSLYITPEHNGIIPRPVIFKDIERGTAVYFQRNTKITTVDGQPFTGYIKPPYTLYSKDFPINFGYTFKSIFKFEPYEEISLNFDPSYEISIPFPASFDGGLPVTVFTYTPEDEQYHVYDTSLVSVDVGNQEIIISANKTDTFFIAQAGENFNKTVFTDTVDHWAHNYIESLYRMGIVKGRDEGIFAPDEYLTRAEFTKIALKSIGEEIDLNEEVKTAPFVDVPLYAWYVPYIKRAKELKLINGYPTGEFKPDQPINKAEAIKILMTAFKFDIASAGERTDSYRDILTDQWYFPAVNFAIKNGIADGKRLGSDVVLSYLFAPDANITRAEMAKLAVKTIELNQMLEEE